MKNIFAISALSLAISTAATGVQAEECVAAAVMALVYKSGVFGVV